MFSPFRSSNDLELEIQKNTLQEEVADLIRANLLRVFTELLSSGRQQQMVQPGLGLRNLRNTEAAERSFVFSSEHVRANGSKLAFVGLFGVS